MARPLQHPSFVQSAITPTRRTTMQIRMNLAVAAALALWTAGAQAQETVLNTRHDVRLLLGGSRVVSGELVAVRDTALLVDAGLENLSLVRPESIEALEVTHPRDVVTNALGGLLIGAAIGALAGAGGGDDSRDTFFAFSAAEKAEMGAVCLGVVGLVVGIIRGVGRDTDAKLSGAEARQLSALRPYARYQVELPDSVQAGAFAQP
jgi:hypothetical protein